MKNKKLNDTIQTNKTNENLKDQNTVKQKPK